MRFVAMVVVMVGCVKDLPVRAPEQCATQGMVLDGETTKIGEDAPDLHCRRVQMPVEKCELQAAKDSLDARSDYSTGGRNTVIFLGFVAFIVPGIIASIVFHAERSGIEDAADKTLRDNTNKCEAAIPTEVKGPPGM